MKTSAFAICTMILLAFSSCDKGDIEVKKLNRGEGIWTIESVRYEQYDAAGASVIATTTYTDVGEMVFFQNTTLSALYDEHLVVVNIKDTTGVITAYPGGVYYDDSRVKIDAPGAFVSGVWTINDNGRKKQEWATYTTNANGGLATRATLHISKK